MTGNKRVIWGGKFSNGYLTVRFVEEMPADRERAAFIESLVNAAKRSEEAARTRKAQRHYWTKFGKGPWE